MVKIITIPLITKKKRSKQMRSSDIIDKVLMKPSVCKQNR